MKFGQRLEQESVPEWSIRTYNPPQLGRGSVSSPRPTSLLTLPASTSPNPVSLKEANEDCRDTDNVDYNSLKHEIKIHTRRDQARAIAIPGQADSDLRRFEEGFYEELCAQHDRVDLFVQSKTAEIASRLGAFSMNRGQGHRGDDFANEVAIDHLEHAIARLAERCAIAPATLKSHKRLLRYQQDVLRCGEDIQALARFTHAQIEAFRKILKKYKVCVTNSS